MPTPDTTSAHGLIHHVGGKCLIEGRGEAWREIKAWVIAFPSEVDMLNLPAVSEPFLAWTMTGEADYQEREVGGPWITHRIRKGTFFLTAGGAPYDCRWKAVTAETLQTMGVFIELPLLQRGFEEVFGADAPNARLKEGSAFIDPELNTLMEQLHVELMRRQASPLYVQGIAQAIAIHLARNHAETVSEPQTGSPSLPGFKLKQVTDWMAGNLSEELNLDRMAAQAGISKFHFHRLFKTAMGTTPSRYHATLRIEAACRMLRETKTSIVEVGMEVGYANPSHFAQLFRKETGLSPSEYRRQR
ncbi:MAG: AraC family transcriptional regulator [Verrucomicrobiota bacterium]